MIFFDDRCPKFGTDDGVRIQSIFNVENQSSVKEKYHQSVKEIIGPESVRNSTSSTSGEILRLNFETCQN